MDGELITSSGGERFKRWKRSAAGEVKRTGRTLVAGRRITAELALRSEIVADWLVPEGWTEPLAGIRRRRFELAGPLFAQLDLFGTGAPLLDVEVAALIRPPAATLDEGLHLLLPFQDPLNVGAAIRTAVGMGVTALHLLPGSANPFHPRAVRASAGAVFAARLHEAEWPGPFLAGPWQTVMLDTQGEPISEWSFGPTVVMVPGVEGPGLEGLTQNCGSAAANSATMGRVSLPMRGIESYNAGVAVALALYAWRLQQK